ncbi:MAG: IS110 family transposase [Chloroflexota bacterium]|nr:IS110 family transposase [Chloroflexota bacterium]
MFFAGVDWADDHHDIAVVNEAGQVVGSRRVSHSSKGMAELRAFLVDIAGDPERIPCFVETSRGLLVAALLEMGFPVYPMNPKTVDRHRKPSGAKTDLIDAYLLARTGRSDLADLRRLQPDSSLIQEMNLLTHDLQTLIQSQTRLLNQLRACLKDYYPVALDLFSKLEQPTTQAFLRAYPTLEAARAASVEELVTLFRQQRHPHADRKAREIAAKLHQPQLAADAVTTRAKSRLMLALMDQLAPLMAQIEAYDQEIGRFFARHPNSAVFGSLPGAGKRIAPRLVVEWGDDRDRYASANSVQALGGTCPVAYQSGGYRKAHKRYACIKPFRDALHQFAFQSARKEPWAAAYYQRKRAEGKSHSMALQALANIWVRIIYAMWLKHEPYDASLFLAARETHLRSAA